MTTPVLWRLLAGLESGVVAGGVMLLYLTLDAGLRGSSVWSVVNLFSSNFYGPAALGSAFRKTSVAGLAWHVWLSGVLGLIISAALGPFLARPARCALVGALLAMGWYYGVVRILWPQWNPLAARHPFPGMLFAHLIFGVAMGTYPRFLAQLRES
ncbi:MAG: hypothetical protein ACREKB_06615 [Candidatus Rokuibacteriota bacterium]